VSIRVVLVDDHPIVLQGLQQLFERQPDFTVVAACAEGDSALKAIRQNRPDVVILDLRMPGRNGLDLLRAMQDEKLDARSVLLTAVISDNEVVEAMKLGATGLVLKESPPDTLLKCVRRVYRGEQWIDQETVTRALQMVVGREAAEREVAQTLTPREIEIVKMIAEGLRNRAVADRLGISEGTVKVHLHNIYEKLALDGRLELVLYAQQKQLV
jgi:two-component system, NarL family, nitrate/nitrite response regulator NarL